MYQSHTDLISYHKETEYVALFKTEERYWIGSYCPMIKTSNDSPPYVWIRGDFSTEAEGLEELSKLSGGEI